MEPASEARMSPGWSCEGCHRRTARTSNDRELSGEDRRPNGAKANRAALDAMVRDHHDRGLTDRRVQAEDVFVPGLRGT